MFRQRIRNVQEKARQDFKKKYPNALLSKFHFDVVTGLNETIVRINILFVKSPGVFVFVDSDSFRNDPNMSKWLLADSPFPKIWRSGGTLQKLPLTDSSMERDSGKIARFPGYVLDYQVNNFNIYVDETQSFKSNLPRLVITTKPFHRDGPNGSMISQRWTLSENYYQSIAAMYIATYNSGISIKHLTSSPDIPKQITSLMRFHVYFTMRRVMHRIDKGEGADILRLYLPNYRTLMKNLPLGGDWNAMIKDIQGDYKRYCAKTSDGITSIGQELLNQSIEVYMYALLGAQAKAKQSIVGGRASAREVQQVFRDIVEDGIAQYSPSVWINLMNKAISTTNVKLDTAVSPNTWLIPSRMVLLKTPIPGYNNLLRESTATGMKFGYNEDLNLKQAHPSSKIHGETVVPKHTEASEATERGKTSTHTPKNKPKEDFETQPLGNYGVPLALIAGILVSRYVV